MRRPSSGPRPGAAVATARTRSSRPSGSARCAATSAANRRAPVGVGQLAVDEEGPDVLERAVLRQLDGVVLAVVEEALLAADVADARLGHDHALEAPRDVRRRLAGGTEASDAQEVAHRDHPDQRHRRRPPADGGSPARPGDRGRRRPTCPARRRRAPRSSRWPTSAAAGSTPDWAARTRSRSVRIPAGGWPASPVTTTEPTPPRTIASAARCSDSSDRAVMTGACMRSTTVRAGASVGCAGGGPGPASSSSVGPCRRH